MNVDYERFGAVVESLLAQQGSVPECLGYELGTPPLAKSYCWDHYASVLGKIIIGHCAKLGMDLYCNEGGDTCFVMEPR